MMICKQDRIMENLDLWIKGILFWIPTLPSFFVLFSVTWAADLQVPAFSSVWWEGSSDMKQLPLETFMEEKLGIAFSPQLICTPGQPCSCSTGIHHSRRFQSRNLVTSVREDRSLPGAFGSRSAVTPTGFSQAAAVECLVTPTWAASVMTSHNNFITEAHTTSFWGRILPLALIL